MKLRALLDRMFNGGAVEDDASHTLDFLPLPKGDDAQRDAKMRAARRKHGRTFRTHERVARQTEPSLLLKAIKDKASASRRKAKPAREANVSPLRRGRTA